jgi:hypothetical protein
MARGLSSLKRPELDLFRTTPFPDLVKKRQVFEENMPIQNCFLGFQLLYRNRQAMLALPGFWWTLPHLHSAGTVSWAATMFQRSFIRRHWVASSPCFAHVRPDIGQHGRD